MEVITLKNQYTQTDTVPGECVLGIRWSISDRFDSWRSKNMDIKTILWYLVLSSVTVAYLVVLAGVRAAKSHDVSHH